MEVTVNPAYLHLGQKITWKIVNVLKISCLFPPMESELVVPPPPPAFLSLSVFHFYFTIYIAVILALYAHSLLSF